jgi:predicted nucleic acid-binding protein
VSDVLDTWAVLRLLEGSLPAASRVEQVCSTERPIMSWINAGEVFSVIRRLAGDPAARATVRDPRPALSLELPTEHRVLEAARLEAEHRIADADAFAASTAIAHDAVLLTGDPELLVDGAPWRFEDLRASGSG